MIVRSRKVSFETGKRIIHFTNDFSCCIGYGQRHRCGKKARLGGVFDTPYCCVSFYSMRKSDHCPSLTRVCSINWHVVMKGTMKAKASALSVADSVLHDVQEAWTPNRQWRYLSHFQFIQPLPSLKCENIDHAISNHFRSYW